jgi:phosphoribosyl 1,2-cyclic phosphodiesterase
MKWIFLGTRGEIEARSRRHGRHSAALVAAGAGRGKSSQGVMLDCGLDWLELVEEVKPAAIVLTHAHPDHAWGLKNGARCPVWATQETWQLIADYPIQDRRVVEAGKAFETNGLKFEAIAVQHSVRCPAVGYRIAAAESEVFYVPDVVAISARSQALRGVDVYIGDGASLTRPLVRRARDTVVGHAPVKTQLGWCRVEGVQKAVFTHCGTEVVTAAEGEAEEQVRRLGLEKGVEATLAFDGMEMVV